MNRSKSAIMITLFVCMGQGKNHYTKASIDKLQELLYKYHKIQVGRRWIFYCIKYLLEMNFITKKKRYKNSSTGKIRQKPSLHAITLEGARYLVAKKVKGAWKLLKSILNYLARKEGRWPEYKDIAPAGELDQYKPSKKEWEDLYRIVTKKID